MELKIYFNRNVSIKSEKQSEFVSKKPKKTVAIGKATNSDTKNELTYQKFIL